MENLTEYGHTYHTITSDIKERYESLIGQIDGDSYLKDIEEASFDFINMVPFILKLVDRKRARELVADFELDTYIAEMFYLYAIEGIPRFLMRNENGVLREQTPNELQNIGFDIDLSAYIAYNELFTCLENSVGGSSPAISMIVVLNQFVARFTLDAATYSGEEGYLSIAEVALLAGMKEKSVRNLATKEMGATYNETRQMTQVSTTNALAWLKGRRKFVPSLQLESPAAKKAFLEIYNEFFG